MNTESKEQSVLIEGPEGQKRLNADPGFAEKYSDLLSVAFCVFAVAVFIVAAYISVLLNLHPHGVVLSYAIAFDVVITVPTAFYFLVVRIRKWPVWVMAPVSAICLGLAYYILPAGFQEPLTYLELAAVPIELGFVAYLIWRIRKSIKSAPSGALADPLDGMREICSEVAGSERIGGLAATEIAMFWYLLKPPRVKISNEDGKQNFGYHRVSGQTAIVLILLFLFAAEGAVVHYLLQLWNTYVAWLVTAATIYGGLWLLSDLRAAIARPVIVDGNRLIFRAGLRFDIEIPRSALESITTIKPKNNAGLVSTSFLGQPSHWIVLKEAIVGNGPYGFRRQASAIGFTPDEPELFAEAVDGLVSQEEGKQKDEAG